jgi:VWFA-related protein
MDSSGSMYESLDMLRKAAERLVKELPPEDDVCIADFSNEGYIDQILTTDRAADLKALGYLKAAGGTAIYDMLFHLADYMRKESRHRSRAIILFSDGEDNASTMKQAALEQDWNRPGTPALHVIAVPQASFMAGGDKKHAKRLARMGGGLVYFPRKAPDLLTAVDHVNEALKSRYLLTYSSDNQSKDGRVRQIDVALDKAHQKAKATIGAPQGYYAPSQ